MLHALAPYGPRIRVPHHQRPIIDGHPYVSYGESGYRRLLKQARCMLAKRLQSKNVRPLCEATDKKLIRLGIAVTPTDLSSVIGAR